MIHSSSDSMPRTRIERVTFSLQVRRATTTPTRHTCMELSCLYMNVTHLSFDLHSSAVSYSRLGQVLKPNSRKYLDTDNLNERCGQNGQIDAFPRHIDEALLHRRFAIMILIQETKRINGFMARMLVVINYTLDNTPARS